MANEVKKKSADVLQMECEAMARAEAMGDLAFMGDHVLEQCVKPKHLAKIREALLKFAESGAARTVQKLHQEGRLK
jgi:23S rRNA maturation mini-RNase III